MFQAQLRNSSGAHDGPDGFGIRIIGMGAPFVVGGGRNNPGKVQGQSGLYRQDPDGTVITDNRNTGTLVGTPFHFSNGGGHVIARMNKSQLDVLAHKRWFVSSFDKAETGADGTFIIADESTNGQYWQLSTYAGNSVSTSGNTFTITAANGSKMQGKVVYPTGVSFTSGIKPRGSAYGSETDNKYVQLNHTGGDFVVVLTVVGSGQSFPSVSKSGSGVVGSVVTVGSRTFTLQTDNVLYNGSAGARIADGSATNSNIDAANLEMSLYPNPAESGQGVNVALHGVEEGTAYQASIISIDGKMVWNNSGTMNQNGLLELPTNLKSGMYIVRVTTAHSITNAKLRIRMVVSYPFEGVRRSVLA